MNPQEICSLLGFTKASFYKALAKLKKLGRAEIGKLNLVSVTLTETEEAEETKDSSTADSHSPSGTSSRPSENLTSPKPPRIKASGNSPNFSSDFYQIFLNSLSDSQRENFLAFCVSQANQLPKPPVLVK